MPHAEPVQDAAEALLVLLQAHGARQVFINPGTDTFPIQEAWARRKERGQPAPEPIMCLHEHTAVAAAHGYFLGSRQPQAVLVHVDAGTLNMGGALHNAQRAEAGMVLCAGRAPYTWEGEMPGGKDLPIHFWQEQLDQAGIVRGLVKWTYELSRTENMASIVERAFHLAANPPSGPVYLTLPREVLMLPMEQIGLPEPRRLTRPTPPAADPDAIRCAAEMLARASRPLIVAGQNGRDPDSVAEVGRLAEQIGARIVATFDYASVPASHPLTLGPALASELPRADAVLFLDPNVPYVPTQVRPNPEAALVQIDREPLHERYVTWNFPMDLRITARVAQALPALRAAIAEQQTAAQRRQAEARCQEIIDQRRVQQAQVAARARAKATETPMDGEWVAWSLKQVLPEGAVVLEDVVTNRPWVLTHLAPEEPDTLFTPGGSSLGWAPNAAIGLKKARPDRPVVALVGDGGFVFSNPLAALWSAQRAGTPFLTVIFNNGGYNASVMPIPMLYPGGAVQRLGDGLVTAIDPPPDYARVAEACGAFGVCVREPRELQPALRRALDEVEHGRCAVVDAILKPVGPAAI
jgi:acetolactate synthase I/II/III large subunit